MNTTYKSKKKSTNQGFQKVFNQFKNHHKTEGYELKNIVDIYLPFWQCKQDIVIEKSVELDRFSRIILQLVKNHYSNHFKICNFLGIDADSFVTTQFHFLLKNDLIREIEIKTDEYEITFEGLNFLKNKSQVKNTETIDFEYFVTERMQYLKNDLTQTFFNPSELIDKNISKGKREIFSGYQIMQSHKIHKTANSKTIEHDNKNRPRFSSINAQRNDFTEFFNRQYKGKYFYDFAAQKLEAHKRNICFLALLFVDKNGEKKVEIRQSKKSVNKFKGFELEETLSKYVEKYLIKNPTFFDKN